MITFFESEDKNDIDDQDIFLIPSNTKLKSDIINGMVSFFAWTSIFSVFSYITV